MSDVPSSVPDLDVLAASPRADASDIGIFFQVLGGKLLGSMPGAVELEREGGLFPGTQGEGADLDWLPAEV
jgi:hypothetical protein